MGKLDNTLIIYIDGDNGTSPEGHAVGTLQPVHRLQRHPRRARAAAAPASTRTGARRRPIRTWRWRGRGRSTRRSSGRSRSPRISAARARAWRSRGRATSRMPAAIRRQFHHIIDIVPTILEATGIQAPAQVDGIAQKPIEGVSMAYTFDKANANAPSARKTQYFEMAGNRGDLQRRLVRQHDAAGRRRGCCNAKFPDIERNTAGSSTTSREDFSQTTIWPRRCPDKLKQMQALFQQRGGEIRRAADRQFAVRARDLAPAERRRRQDGVHLHGRESRHPDRQRAQHPEQGRSRSPPRSRFRRAAATG